MTRSDWKRAFEHQFNDMLGGKRLMYITVWLSDTQSEIKRYPINNNQIDLFVEFIDSKYEYLGSDFDNTVPVVKRKFPWS